MTLTIREPRPEDEAYVARASAELSDEDFDFALRRDAESWEEYLARVQREHDGIDP